MSDSTTIDPTRAVTREEFLAEIRKYPDALEYIKVIQERLQRGEYFDTHNKEVRKTSDKTYIVVNVDVKKDGTLIDWGKGNPETQPVWVFPSTKGYVSHCRNPLMISEIKGKKYVNDSPLVTGVDGITRFAEEGKHVPYCHDMWITRCARGTILRDQYETSAGCNPMKELFKGNVVRYQCKHYAYDEWLMAYPLADFIAESF